MPEDVTGQAAGINRPARLAQVLRTHGLVIVCVTTGWALRPDPHAPGRPRDLMIA
jgi:hypothetical protein